MSRRNGKVQSLTILDYDDRSLLAILDDEADYDGWATTEAIAVKVFGTGGSETRRLHATRCVAIRFSWLMRYGVVENGQKPEGRVWRLTDDGMALLEGTSKTTRIANAIDRSLDADLLHVAMEVAARYDRAAPIAQTMMRRAFTHSTGRR